MRKDLFIGFRIAYAWRIISGRFRLLCKRIWRYLLLIKNINTKYFYQQHSADLDRICRADVSITDGQHSRACEIKSIDIKY